MLEGTFITADTSIGPDELASRANVTRERVDELAKLGLLEAHGDRFVATDVGRIAVVEALVCAGVPLADLVETAAAGIVSLAWFEGVLPPSPELGDRTYREVLKQLDLPAALVSTNGQRAPLVMAGRAHDVVTRDD